MLLLSAVTVTCQHKEISTLYLVFFHQSFVENIGFLHVKICASNLQYKTFAVLFSVEFLVLKIFNFKIRQIFGLQTRVLRTI